jgi:hypothetical protein
MHNAMKVGVRNRITAKGDNEGFASVGMYIGRGLAKEL